MNILIKLKENFKEKFKIYFIEKVGRWVWGFAFLTFLILTVQKQILINYILLAFLLLLGFIIFYYKSNILKIISVLLSIIISIKSLFFHFSYYINPLIEGYFNFNVTSKYILNDFLLLFFFIIGFLVFLMIFKMEFIEKDKKETKEWMEFDIKNTKVLIKSLVLFFLILGGGYLIFRYPVKPIEKIIQAIVLIIVLIFRNINLMSKKEDKSKIEDNLKTDVFIVGFVIFSMFGHYLWNFLLMKDYQNAISLLPPLEQTLSTNFLVKNIFPVLFIIATFWLIFKLMFIICTKISINLNWNEAHKNNPDWKLCDQESKLLYKKNLQIFVFLLIFSIFFFLLSPAYKFLFKLIVLLISSILFFISYFISKKYIAKKEFNYAKKLNNFGKKDPVASLLEISRHNFHIFNINLTPIFFLIFLIGLFNFAGSILINLAN